MSSAATPFPPPANITVEHAFTELIRSHLRKLSSTRERMAYLVKMLWHSPYIWGSEEVGATDCSGSVCWALWLLGFKIRVTADAMFHNLTGPTFNQMSAMPGDLKFFWDATHSKLEHVNMFSDPGVCMNASPDGFKDLVTAPIAMSSTPSKECRSLDWNKVKQASDSGQFACDVDPVLVPLFGLFKED